MADFLTKESRSALMSRVRSRGSAAELFVRQAVWTAGFRYRLNVRKLPGTPDLVLRRYRTVVLVQGCFWHGHSCRKGQRRPTSNQEFWNRKLDGNLARDAANQVKLQELGWTVILIWECLLQEGTDALLTHLLQLREDGITRSNDDVKDNHAGSQKLSHIPHCNDRLPCPPTGIATDRRWLTSVS